MNKTDKNNFKHKLILAFVPLAAFIIRLIGRTMRIRLEDPHRVAPQARSARKFIYVFWHNQQLLSTFFFRNFGIKVLVSRSRDGDYIAKALHNFGFGTVRSSTSSGKVSALRGLARELRSDSHAAITPDGPRGPRYQAQPGAVFLGAMTGHEVAPFGCAADRVWRLQRSWDKFEIPKPFSKAVIIFGRPVSIPKKPDEQAVAKYTRALEQDMNALRNQALHSLGRSEE
jgi:lysophospholipid acyltransferase (LPLAT)-like uncharacterized protein